MFTDPLVLSALVDERQRRVMRELKQARSVSLRRAFGTLVLRVGWTLAVLGARLDDDETAPQHA